MPSLQFKGRVFVENFHLGVPFHELTPVRAKGSSRKASLHDNLIVEGDNLLALKALLPTYHRKVKCIYIDPPYNTGNEGWKYNDRVNSPMMQEWFGRVVDREDLTRHDKWCCMMLPRLKLLRELLADDGAIFVSVDDNEVHRLRCLMDEVFGEENFVGMIIWRNVTDNNPTNISVEHEYIACYAASKDHLEKTWHSASLPVKEKLIAVGEEFINKYHDDAERQTEYAKWFKENRAQLKPLDRYRFIDNRGVYTGSQSVHNPGKEGYRYDVIHPATGRPCKQPLMGYRFPHDTMLEKLRNDEILFGKDENKIVEIKLYASEYKSKLPSVIELDTRLSSYELKGIFPQQKRIFEYAKPSELIREVLSFATDQDSIVLDSFAGSGTTAHAVLALNKEDGGNRRFVLVECEDYVDSITAERVRRVAKGVALAKDESVRTGLGGVFSYLELGAPLRKEALLDPANLPGYEKLAGYVFFTATGEEFDPEKVRRDRWFIGRSRVYDVFLIYTDDVEELKNLALTQNIARKLSGGKRPKLVFAPTKYLDQDMLHHYRIRFQQLPFEIYESVEKLER